MRLKNRIFQGIAISFILFFSIDVYGVITGQCSDCHTMHNSQNGAAMVTFIYGSETPDAQEYLLRGTCLGCHAQGTSNMIATVNGNDVPQVYHTDPAGDLAGGNFAYILGAKGSGASDGKGHNVIEFGNPEDTLTDPPGHHIPSTIGINITCASGTYGCHGKRLIGGSIKGAHHNNVDGQLNTADEIYNSYRFLMGVKGLENPGAFRWQNIDANNHNEYFGASTPLTFGGNCNACHSPKGIYPANNSISAFCSSCHQDLHSLPEIGGDTNSPFLRHPTDVILPAGGEYANYTSYSVLAPVARTSVPGSMSGIVNPGIDVVMCLSCHAAHASDNEDMLRWDYRNSNLATALSGCSTCHTAKD